MEEFSGGLRSDGLAMVFGLEWDVDINGMICITEYIVRPEEVKDGFWQEGDWFCDHEDWQEPLIINAKNLMPIIPEADPLEVQETEQCHNN
jgi:hypothetical protein